MHYWDASRDGEKPDRQALHSVPVHQPFNLTNRYTHTQCCLLLSDMPVHRSLNNLKPVEFVIAHCNCLFAHEKYPRKIDGDILEWFKGGHYSLALTIAFFSCQRKAEVAPFLPFRDVITAVKAAASLVSMPCSRRKLLFICIAFDIRWR